jgi:hypothetical protein
MKQTSRVILAGLIATGLLCLTATLADYVDLAFINTWALMHGTGLLVFPVWFALAYLVLGGAAAFTAAPALALLSVGLVCVGSLVPFGSAPGLVVAHLARHRSGASAVHGGRGMSLVALIVGYLSLAFWAYVTIVVGRAAQLHHP